MTMTNNKEKQKTSANGEKDMARTILLTSLSASENEQPVRYFSVRNKYGYSYCDAILSVEASTKYVLSRYDIDEIFVIGRNSTFDEGDDERPIVLKEGSSFYSANIQTLSAYSLYRYRIAQFIDELTIEQQEYMELLDEEAQEQVIAFIRNFFQEDNVNREVKKNRCFDELARDRNLYESFKNKLIETVPGASDDPRRYIRWAKNYLYSTFKPSWKLEILPVNEDVSVRYIPTSLSESGEQVDNMMSIAKTITGGESSGEINLFVSLHSEDAADNFILMNMLEILKSMPGSRVRVQRVFTISGTHRELTSRIHDNTEGFGITELVASTRAFLRYGKADMIVDFWEKSGERNERIASMIYAMRHIDTGLSMCNIREMEGGIIRLRELFRTGVFMGESGYYSRLFNLIADGIRKDYGSLLEGDEIVFIDLVRWAYRHHFYQQTLTLIESRGPENFVNAGIFYYCDDESKIDSVVNLLAMKRLELKAYEYYKMDDIDHYFIKSYDRAGVRSQSDKNVDRQEAYAIIRTESLKNTDPNMLTGYTACDNRQTLQNLLYAYYHIGNMRNKINHAEDEGMVDTRLVVAENDQSQAFIWLKDGIDFFIDSYENAMKEVEGKNPKIVKITSSQVKQWAETIGRGEKREKQEKQEKQEEQGKQEKQDEQGKQKKRKWWRRKRPQAQPH